MNVYKSIDDFSSENATCVTTGTFDGLHLGHEKIINALTDLSKKKKCDSLVLTFWPHPRRVLFPDSELFLLNSIEERLQRLESLGVDHVVVQEFTKAFSRTTFTHYIRDLLIKALNMKHLVVGHDHQFGKNREGTIDDIKELQELYDFNSLQIEAEQSKDVNISSTKIRNALNLGKVDVASKYLGYNYTLSGKVVHGRKQGRTIGFPTANITPVESLKMIPMQGVYAVEIRIKGNSEVFKAMANVGTKPTFGVLSTSIEVHIFNFSKEIYDKEIQITFVSWMRAVKKFSGVDALKEALNNDKIRALNLL